MTKMRDECGVLGVRTPHAATAAVLGLHALQHRGQESAGMATYHAGMHLHKGMGLVERVFTDAPPLPGDWAVGHNRYSTCGRSVPENAGPFTVDTTLGPLVLAHNGNIVNANEIRSLLNREYGLLAESESDSELLALLLAVAPGTTWEDRLDWMSRRAHGAYALVLLTTHEGDACLIGVRDPRGIRPLALGRLASGWALASESCAFSVMGGRPVRDLAPGEIVRIDATGPVPAGTLTIPNDMAREAFCVFEYIYLARPDTRFAGRSVHASRRAMGQMLARDHPVDADLVISVPDSGTSAALGYAAASGIPYGEGLIKNRYVARTFIQPEQTERERLIRMKFATLPLDRLRVVLVDDSIVRGNTLRPIVALLREAGACEVHVRIACPPITDPCYFGVDIASRGELIANHLNECELAAHVGADSLHYLSISSLLAAIERPEKSLCLACLTGRYPISTEHDDPAEPTVVKAGQR